jgi:hypothetical protein
MLVIPMLTVMELLRSETMISICSTAPEFVQRPDTPCFFAFPATKR